MDNFGDLLSQRDRYYMIKALVAIGFVVFSSICLSTEYRGYLGATEISMSLDGEYSGAYFYHKYRTPIALIIKDGSNDNNFIYREMNGDDAIAEFHLSAVDSGLEGYWVELRTGKKIPVKLSAIDDPRGAIQIHSFEKQYVRIQCDEEKVIHIIDKKTDDVQSTLKAEGVCSNHYDLDIGDYNFDGHLDFSVYEYSYAGPNTSRVYFLYNPGAHQYSMSDQLGMTSLSFDPKAKTVTSTNQCCAGSRIAVETYQWQASTLKLVNGVCYVLDDNGEQVAKPLSTCD